MNCGKSTYSHDFFFQESFQWAQKRDCETINFFGNTHLSILANSQYQTFPQGTITIGGVKKTWEIANAKGRINLFK